MGPGQATRSCFGNAPTQTSLPKKTSRLKLPGFIKASRSLDPKDLLSPYLDATHPKTPHRVLPRARVRAGPSRLRGPGVSCPCYCNGLSLEQLQRQRLLRKWSLQQRAAGGGDRHRSKGRALDALTQHPSECKLTPASGHFGRSARLTWPLAALQLTPVPFPPCLAIDANQSTVDPCGSNPSKLPFPKGVGRVSPRPLGCLALAVQDSLPPLSRPSFKLPLEMWALRAGCVWARLCLGTLLPAALEFVLAGPDRSLRVVSGQKPCSNLSGKDLEQAVVPPRAHQTCFSQSWEVRHRFTLIQCWSQAGRASTLQKRDLQKRAAHHARAHRPPKGARGGTLEK